MLSSVTSELCFKYRFVTRKVERLHLQVGSRLGGRDSLGFHVLPTVLSESGEIIHGGLKGGEAQCATHSIRASRKGAYAGESFYVGRDNALWASFARGC